MSEKVNEIEGGDAFYVLDRPCVLGEGPIYRASDSTLHYVDCIHDPPQLHILSVDPETGEAVEAGAKLAESSVAKTNRSKPGLRVLDLEDSVTVMAFRKDVPGSYICLYYQGFAFMDEQTGRLEVLKEIIPKEERHVRRFNDGGVDPAGRFWGAEIDVKGLSHGRNNLPADHGRPCGRLWRYDPDGTVKQMADGLVCGNGIGWSPDKKTMYLHDSCAQYIYAYDYDNESGDISNARVLRCFIDTPHEPDGMVVDSEGNIWVAMFGGHCVMVLDPQGNTIKTIKAPARNMACTTWGGKNHNIIYAVSAYDKTPNRDPSDQGGHLFKYHVDAQGQPKYDFAG